MKKFLLRLHRRFILRTVRFWQTRWGERSLIILLAILIGAAAAIAAALLHMLVTRLEAFGIWLAGTPHDDHGLGWLGILLVLPLAGMLLSFLVQRYLGGPRYAKSLSPLILALNRRRTGIPAVEIVSHMLSSALSVGLGGSAGLEAPSVLTGAAIGSNSAGFLHIDRRHRSLLVGCGSAAAISAIFDSPIAGVLFAAEVLLPEFSVSALIPMIMSSAVATVVSRQIIGDNQFFLAINAPWQANAIPCYFLCGIFCALVGVYVIKAAYFTSAQLKSRFRNPWLRLFAGGSVLCVILLVFPLLRGQGLPLYREALHRRHGGAGRLGAAARLDPLPVGAAGGPGRGGDSGQGDRFGADGGFRRRRRHLRSFDVHRRLCRIRLRATGQPDRSDPAAGVQLRRGRHVRGLHRRDARAADRNLPHRRSDRWLHPAGAADDRLVGVMVRGALLRAELHLPEGAGGEQPARR
ncbi:MAG: chloride channel protein [Lentisphaeria bacterium]|nr:MAG: chloride channel protein [Lentisphaeria bacterium]